MANNPQADSRQSVLALFVYVVTKYATVQTMQTVSVMQGNKNAHLFVPRSELFKNRLGHDDI